MTRCSPALLPVSFLASLLLALLLWLPQPAAASLLHVAGSVPETLGLNGGVLPPCPSANHCVREDWPMADPAAGLARLRAVLATTPATRIESGAEPDATYLHATAESRLFGFIDDLEFASDPEHGVLQVRSASRLGDSDLGVNQRRVDLLKTALQP